MPSGARNWSTALACVAVALAFGVELLYAQGDGSVPEGCYLDCKQQYLLLDSYSDHSTSVAIKGAFGEPKFVAKGKTYEITTYVGTAVEFLIVKSILDNSVDGVGIYAKKGRSLLTGDESIIPTRPLLAHARIPFLRGGGTLADINLEEVIRDCPGTVDKIGGLSWRSAQFQEFWTPACDFGRRGTWQRYSFLFDVPDCEPRPSEGFSMEELKGSPYRCSRLAGTLPKAVVVTPEGVDPAKLGRATFNYIHERE